MCTRCEDERTRCGFCRDECSACQSGNTFRMNNEFNTLRTLNEFNTGNNFYNEDIYLKKDFYYLLSEDELDDVSTLISIYNDRDSNIIGNVLIKLNEEEIGNLNIYRNKKKKQLSFFEKIKNYLLDIL